MKSAWVKRNQKRASSNGTGEEMPAKKKNDRSKNKVEKVMREYKSGELHSGSKKGPRVKSRKQAIAIALSEARKAGEDVKPKSRKPTKRAKKVVKKRKR
jgi:hypothetical protein